MDHAPLDHNNTPAESATKPTLFHASPYPMHVIEPRHQNVLGGKEKRPLVFAQEHEVIANAFALKTPAAFTGGHNPAYAYTVIDPARGSGDWENILPKNAEGKPGGFVYEVDNRSFKKTFDDGQIREWASPKPATIDPEKTRFVTVDEALKSGVQIFVVKDAAKYRSSRAWSEDPMRLLKDGIADGGLQWLNQERGFNPIPPPPPNEPQADTSPSLHRGLLKAGNLAGVPLPVADSSADTIKKKTTMPVPAPLIEPPL